MGKQFGVSPGLYDDTPKKAGKRGESTVLYPDACGRRIQNDQPVKLKKIMYCGIFLKERKPCRVFLLICDKQIPSDA